MFVPGACVPREPQVRRLRLVTSVCLLATVRGSLHFHHQRQAHFRLPPSQKATFVRQATVRPDLPPPASARVGYRVEREAVAALVRPIAGRLAASIMRRNWT